MPRDAEGGGHSIATACDGEFDDVLRIEVIRVRGKAGAGGMFDALVHRQDGEVARAAEAPGIKQLLQTAQDLGIAIRGNEDAIHKVRAGQVQALLGGMMMALCSRRLRADSPRSFVIFVLIVQFRIQWAAQKWRAAAFRYQAG